MNKLSLLVLSVSVITTSVHASPELMLRVSVSQTRTKEKAQNFLKLVRRYPHCCTDVWFSSNAYSAPEEVHARNAENIHALVPELKRLGISTSLQIQWSIGHRDRLVESEFEGTEKNWGGWTGPQGLELNYVSCPRQEKFLRYLRKLGGIYGVVKPAFVWIDDDLRITNHRPALKSWRERGCWCETCLKAFNQQVGGSWTRETMGKEVAQKTAVAQTWDNFQCKSLAGVAQALAEGFHESSPETQMGIQICCGVDTVTYVKEIVNALYRVSGHPVGVRLGGGFYYDVDPNDQMKKCFDSVQMIKLLDGLEGVGVWCPEVESYPHAYGSRSPQSAIMESFVACAYGCNGSSYWVTGSREDDEVWHHMMLPEFHEAYPVLKGYMEANEGTEGVGYVRSGLRMTQNDLWKWARTGVSVLPGPGKVLGEIADSDWEIDFCKVSSKDIQALRNRLRSPAHLLTPFVGYVIPRVTKEGLLKTVALVNTRIGTQKNIQLALQKVKGTVAMWHELGQTPQKLDGKSTSDGLLITVPRVAPWSAGYLTFD